MNPLARFKAGVDDPEVRKHLPGEHEQADHGNREGRWTAKDVDTDPGDSVRRTRADSNVWLVRDFQKPESPVVGYMEWHYAPDRSGEYSGTAKVDVVEVNPEYRRQGVARLLLTKLKSTMGSDYRVDPGQFTPDGAALWESVFGEKVPSTAKVLSPVDRMWKYEELAKHGDHDQEDHGNWARHHMKSVEFYAETDPEYTKKMQDFFADVERSTWQNPLMDNVRGISVVGSQTPENPEAIGMVELSARLSGDQPTVYVTGLMASPTGKGAGKKMFNRVLELADKHGVALSLYPKAFGTGDNILSTAQLKKWYASEGFKKLSGTDDWVRKPQAENQPRIKLGDKLKKAFDPDQPRAPAGVPNGGQWVSSGGQSGTVFVSPNIDEDLDWEAVDRNLSSRRHEQSARMAAEVYKLVGLEGFTYNGVGAWSDGQENTLVASVPKSNMADLRAAASMQGLLLDQKAAIAFQTSPDGDATLYEMLVPGKDLREVNESLKANGVLYHTMVPTNGGVKVLVFDPDSSGEDNVDKATDALGVDEIKRFRGHGAFVGDSGDSPTRVRARSEYRKEVDAWLEVRGHDRRGEWERLHLSWGERFGRILKRIAALFGKFDPDQPRAPAGSPEGGQWVAGPAGEAGAGGLRDAGGVRGGAGGLAASGSPDPAAAPLSGLPSPVDIKGYGPTAVGPYLPAREAAAAYRAQAGITAPEPTAYAKLDRERAKRIADEFERMPHNPGDPEVKAAYAALIDETVAQWKVIEKTGLKVEFIDFAKTGDPYAANPRLATEDVVRNNHLWVFPTVSGFGSDASVDVSDNPLLADTGIVIGGHRLVANDVFRIVHDYFGHIKEGIGFRAEGEENAWRQHSAMYSPLARRAMTTETRGQNSWLNFGPHGEKNRTANAADTHYADQKVGLLPLWVSEDGALEKAAQRFLKYDPDQPRAPEGSPNGGQWVASGQAETTDWLHGTDPKNVQSILDKGFDVARSRAGRQWFGVGVYATNVFAKAREFSEGHIHGVLEVKFTGRLRRMTVREYDAIAKDGEYIEYAKSRDLPLMSANGATDPHPQTATDYLRSKGYDGLVIEGLGLHELPHSTLVAFDADKLKVMGVTKDEDAETWYVVVTKKPSAVSRFKKHLPGEHDQADHGNWADGSIATDGLRPRNVDGLRSVVDRVADTLGAPRSQFVVVEGPPEPFEVAGVRFKAAGTYHRPGSFDFDTKETIKNSRIRLYWEELKGLPQRSIARVIAHEVQHHKFNEVWDNYFSELVSFSETLRSGDGEVESTWVNKRGFLRPETFDQLAEHYPTLASLSFLSGFTLEDQTNLDAELRKTGRGISSYSALYWTEYENNRGTALVKSAFDETLAEIAGMEVEAKRAGRDLTSVKAPEQWVYFYKQVSDSYSRLAKQGLVRKSESAAEIASIRYLDEGFNPVSPATAKLVKIRYTDGAVTFAVPDTGITKFDPNQPRVPKGESAGGQWTKEGGIARELVGEREEKYETKAGEPRVRTVREFRYLDPDGKEIKDAATLTRLKALGVPPGVDNVLINPDPAGRLQAIWTDAKGRQAALYSKEHTRDAAMAKFERLREFNEAYPAIRAKIADRLNSDDETEREAAGVLYMISLTGFRIGGTGDTGAEEQAYGAATLLNKHVSVSGDKVRFEFTGKHGVKQTKTVEDERLAEIVRSRKTSKWSQPLFDVSPARVRDVFKSIAGPDYMVKDMRTHMGTATALREIGKRKGPAPDEKTFAKWQREVATKVSDVLGNTPTIAMGSYIDFHVWDKWRKPEWGPWVPKKLAKSDPVSDDDEIREFAETIHGTGPARPWREVPVDDPDDHPDPPVSRFKKFDENQPRVPAGNPNGGQWTTADGLTESPGFKAWFGKSKVTDIYGNPMVVYHGTLTDFSSFDRDRASPESDFGAGFYFSSGAEDIEYNYATHEGPDFKNKLSARLASEGLEEGSQIPGASGELLDITAEDYVRQQMTDHGGATMPVYLSFQNPFMLGDGAKGTDSFLPYNIEYDENGEDIVDEGGPALDFINAVRDIASEYNDTEPDKIVGALYETMADWGGLSAKKIDEAMRGADNGLAYATDDEGRLVRSEIYRRALEAAGFDGIIDSSVGRKFMRMDGVQGAKHYIAFRPEQIKSAIGNSGAFDPKDRDITKHLDGEHDQKDHGNWAHGLEVTHRYVDNPGGEWLEGEREYAESSTRRAAGAQTARINITNFPVAELMKLPGYMDEHLKVDFETSPKMAPILDSLRRGESIRDPIFVMVNHKGKAWLAEGNHRTRAAAKVGLATAPVEIAYFAGGEREEGPFKISQFPKPVKKHLDGEHDQKSHGIWAHGSDLSDDDRLRLSKETLPKGFKWRSLSRTTSSTNEPTLMEIVGYTGKWGRDAVVRSLFPANGKIPAGHYQQKLPADRLYQDVRSIEAFPAPLEVPESFESKEAADRWMQKATEHFGHRGRMEVSSVYRQAYPKIKAVYDEHNKGIDTKNKEIGAAARKEMKDLGLKIGDRVEAYRTGAFLSTIKLTGELVNYKGVPHVKLDSEVPVEGPGGRITYRTRIPWSAKTGFVKPSAVQKFLSIAKYDPDQPRAPEGSEIGGQWIAGGAKVDPNRPKQSDMFGPPDVQGLYKNTIYAAGTTLLTLQQRISKYSDRSTTAPHREEIRALLKDFDAKTRGLSETLAKSVIQAAQNGSLDTVLPEDIPFGSAREAETRAQWAHLDEAGKLLGSIPSDDRQSIKAILDQALAVDAELAEGMIGALIQNNMINLVQGFGADTASNQAVTLTEAYRRGLALGDSELKEYNRKAAYAIDDYIGSSYVYINAALRGEAAESEPDEDWVSEYVSNELDSQVESAIENYDFSSDIDSRLDNDYGDTIKDWQAKVDSEEMTQDDFDEKVQELRDEIEIDVRNTKEAEIREEVSQEIRENAAEAWQEYQQSMSREYEAHANSIQELLDDMPPTSTDLILRRNVKTGNSIGYGTLSPGDDLNLKGFTSLGTMTQSSFGSVQLMVHVPKGSSDVLPTTNDGETEVILNHDVDLRVLAVDRTNKVVFAVYDPAGNANDDDEQDEAA